MFWTHALVALAGLAGGWLLGHRTTVRCVICGQPLPPFHPDARCGGTPGLPPAPPQWRPSDDYEARLRAERQRQEGDDA